MQQTALDLIGTYLALIGTVISMIGVVYNNCFLSHETAMIIWLFSNAIFVFYFYGRLKGYWDGGLPDALLCLNYIVMLVTGIWGLCQ